MAAHICSANGASQAFGWSHGASHPATPSWIAAGGSHSGDKRVHAWATPPEHGLQWAQSTEDAKACPRPCRHVATEIVCDQSELPADSTWICAMDEVELQNSVDLYLPDDNFVATDPSEIISCTPAGDRFGSQSVAAVMEKVSSIPTASFSLLGALSMLKPQLQPEPQPAPAVQRGHKAVSIGKFSVVRVFETSEAAVHDASMTLDSCSDEEKERGMTPRDVRSLTHTEDGPRAENLLLDRLIVTHFEGWALTNPGAIAKFVGGDDRLCEAGPGLIDRLEEMIASLDSGAVRHVGVLPSCVRMGLNHLPHLRTLHSWVVAGFQYVSSMKKPPAVSSYDDEADDGETDVRETDGMSAHDRGSDEGPHANDLDDERPRCQQMDQDEIEMVG